MEPGVHAGVPETLDTQHGLLSGAEHRERLIVKLTLHRELNMLLETQNNQIVFTFL